MRLLRGPSLLIVPSSEAQTCELIKAGAPLTHFPLPPSAATQVPLSLSLPPNRHGAPPAWPVCEGAAVLRARPRSVVAREGADPLRGCGPPPGAVDADPARTVVGRHPVRMLVVQDAAMAAMLVGPPAPLFCFM